MTCPRSGTRVVVRLLVTSITLALALSLPVSAPQAVRAAGLSDQIEAARQRQQELAGSIARSEALLQ